MQFHFHKQNASIACAQIFIAKDQVIFPLSSQHWQFPVNIKDWSRFKSCFYGPPSLSAHINLLTMPYCNSMTIQFV